MSDCSAVLSIYLIKKYFGNNEAAIIRLMQKHGPLMLRTIERLVAGRFSSNKIAGCLTNLLAHNALYVANQTPLAYGVNYKGILQLARIPIFCKVTSNHYGPLAENLLSFVLLNGMCKCSEVLRAAVMRSSLNLKKDDKYKMAQAMVDCLAVLVSSGILNASTKSTLLHSEEKHHDFQQFFISKPELQESINNFISAGGDLKSFRKLLPNSKMSVEWDLILTANPDYLEALWRDQLIIRLASERIDETAGVIMSTILRFALKSRESGSVLCDKSEVVSYQQIVQGLENVPENLDSYLYLLKDDVMSLLEQKAGIVGGLYQCDYKKVIKNIFIRHVENIVQVLFENAGLRILRILLREGPLTYETLERRLLIPQEEFRKTLPQMVASGFIVGTEFSRAKEFNADTVVCVYSVNLASIARLTIDYAQHCLLCLAQLSDNELAARERLIDQRYRVELLIRSHEEKMAVLKAQSEADVEEEALEGHRESVQALANSLTPAEVAQLSTLAARLAKLSAVHWEAETAWFVADLHLRLNAQRDE